ncbi:hypothetical protein ACSFA2_17550 [Variovorax sp. LT2P21]|uniref:hypothetical protein n=1 Tax=Variovorax sp. LT2P21 TaxID=3443731 RepID=UPI003F44E453
METLQETANPHACSSPPRHSVVDQVSTQPPAIVQSRYLAALGALFALFSSARVLAYLPTIWAVLASGDSSQHSLLTWFTFFGGNATMAVWLWEQNARRCNAAIAASGGNALMCLAIIAVVTWTRL